MSFVQRASKLASVLAVAVLVAACSLAVNAPSTVPDATTSVAGVATNQPAGTPVLTASPIASPTPIVVKDGEPWIAYHWFAPGKDAKDLFLVRPDGSDAHAILADLPGSRSGASWSPDGRRLAFNESDAAHPKGTIWTSAADGSDASVLTDGEGSCPDGIAHPNWSPDGTQLALICYPDPGGKEGSVATFDLATRKITRLYTVNWPEHVDGPPSWSPDGKTLAFAILHWDPTDQFLTGSLVAKVPVTGGEAQRLTTFDTHMSSPAWSPDGSEIVMNSYDLGNGHTSDHPSNLYAIEPDGSGQRQITFSSVGPAMRIAAPQWTPDGTKLLADVATGPGSVVVTVNDVELAFVDPAGGEPVLFSPTIHGAAGDLRPTP